MREGTTEHKQVPNVVTRQESVEFAGEHRFRPLFGVDQRAENVAESHQAASRKGRSNVPSVHELNVIQAEIEIREGGQSHVTGVVRKIGPLAAARGHVPLCVAVCLPSKIDGIVSKKHNRETYERLGQWDDTKESHAEKDEETESFSARGVQFALPDGIHRSSTKPCDDGTVSVSPDVLFRTVIDVVEEWVVRSNDHHSDAHVVQFGSKIIMVTRTAVVEMEDAGEEEHHHRSDEEDGPRKELSNGGSVQPCCIRQQSEDKEQDESTKMCPNIESFVVPMEERHCCLFHVQAHTVAMGNVRVVFQIVRKMHVVLQIIVLRTAHSAHCLHENFICLFDLRNQL